MKLKAALLILYDSKKRFLLQHRSEDAGVLPGYWAFFGGGIRKGETPEDTISREAFEELNYKVKEPRLFTEQNFKLDDTKGHMYVYIDAFYGDKSELKLKEGQGWGWYSVSEIGKLKMIDHDKELVESLTHYLGNNNI